MKGSEAPGPSYPTSSYHPQWLLTSGPLLGTQKPSAQLPSPLQCSKHHLKPPATAALRFPRHFLHASSFVLANRPVLG